MKITLYSTSTCPKCTELKQYLDAKNQTYETVVLDVERDRLPEFQEVSGGAMTVPVTVFEKDNGEKVVVKGFEPPEVDSALA